MRNRPTTSWLAITIGLGLLLTPALRTQGIPTTEVCKAAFSQGIRDNWYLFTERQQFEACQYSFTKCRAPLLRLTQRPRQGSLVQRCRLFGGPGPGEVFEPLLPASYQGLTRYAIG